MESGSFSITGKALPGTKTGSMHHNRPAHFARALALSAGIFSGVIVGAMSSNPWEGVSTGSAIAAAFVLTRIPIRS